MLIKNPSTSSFCFQAVASGRSAAHVAVSARDSNKFTVSVNVAPKSEAQFQLIYEELLERKLDQYELVLNIHPGQVLQKLNVEVRWANICKLFILIHSGYRSE